MRKVLMACLLCVLLGEALAGEHGVEEGHHNKYELELSFNDANHVEFTGSVYFMPKKKVQVTADQSFHHFASVVVQELPFENSKWGTFFGAGLAFAKIEQAYTHEYENEFAGIVQSGLAYAIDSHWSPGFTLSPGYSFTHDNFVMGATLDIVYGF